MRSSRAGEVAPAVEGGVLEEEAERDLGVEVVAEAGGDAGSEQGVAAEQKKVIVRADSLQVEQRCQHG